MKRFQGWRVKIADTDTGDREYLEGFCALIG